jgi:hypothetical protein
MLTCIFSLDPVEEVFDHHADRPVRRRRASCLLWELSQWNFDARIHLMRSFLSAYSYFASTYWPQLPSLGSCHGMESAAARGFGCSILSSYLLLFVKFYIDTYKKPARGKKPLTNGHADGDGFVHL